MTKIKTQNKSKLGLMIGLLILSVGLFVSTKLVQNSQENRSQAASSNVKYRLNKVNGNCSDHSSDAGWLLGQNTIYYDKNLFNSEAECRRLFGCNCYGNQETIKECVNIPSPTRCSNNNIQTCKWVATGASGYYAWVNTGTCNSSTSTKTSSSNTTSKTTTSKRPLITFLSSISSLLKSSKTTTTIKKSSSGATTVTATVVSKSCKDNGTSYADGQKFCSGSKLKICDRGSISNYKDCASSNQTCSNGNCINNASGYSYNKIYNETDAQIIAKLNIVLKGVLSNTGSYFVKYAKKENNDNVKDHDRDPYLMAAIAIHESWGGYSCDAKNKNNVGEVMSGGYPVKYSNIEAGIKAIFTFAGTADYRASALTWDYNTPSSSGYTTSQFLKMQKVYNTSTSESNGWITSVTKYYKNLRQGTQTGIVPPAAGKCF